MKKIAISIVALLATNLVFTLSSFACNNSTKSLTPKPLASNPTSVRLFPNCPKS